MSASYYSAQALRPGAYRLTSAENVYMDLFVGKEKALLWDTGYGFGDLLGKIREITDLPLTVVNSHGHPDHACGNFQFPSPVYIHPDDMELCRQFNSKSSRAAAVEASQHFYNFALQREVSLLPENFDPAAYIEAPAPALAPLDAGHVFDLGGIQLETVHLPGHTGGSLALFWRDERLLYVGDAIAGFIFLFLPESKGLRTYRASLDKAEALPFDTMVPGHGFDPIPRAMLSRFRRGTLELDYSKGLPFRPMPGMVQVPDTRICILDGRGLEDFGKPDFVSIVIDPTHID